MRINLVSELDENSQLEKISGPSPIYAWFLNKAFLSEGVDCHLVKGQKIITTKPPKADHTIVISSAASYMVSDVKYIQKLRASTVGKLTFYMNIDKLRGGKDRHFDYCFTQIGPTIYHPKKYICVGWGVDPNYSYPEQDEKAAFLDSKSLNLRKLGKIQRAYQVYDAVLPETDIKVYNPVPTYNKSRRLPYPDYQSILRKCHYFLCTQFGDGGLTRLEAAACGALLVVPRRLYRKRTMRLFNHRVWRTEEEFVNILHENVEIEANRQRALEHSWEKVVKRILEVLNS